MSRKVEALVPLDGSDLAETIFPALRGLNPIRVTLLHVLERASSTMFGKANPREAAEAYLVEAGDRARKAGLSNVSHLLLEGNPAETIIDTAGQMGASLLALSTHGRTGFDRLVFGSVAEKVIRSGPAPVLALRTGLEIPFHRSLLDRVLVPLDGSETAWQAIESLFLLMEPAQTRLTMFGVVETLGNPLPAARNAEIEALADRYYALQEAHLGDVLRMAGRRASDFGFEVSVEVETGLPAAKILDRAESLRATLIAMSTHGRSGVSRWALGSVTEKVLRASTFPLLIARAK